MNGEPSSASTNEPATLEPHSLLYSSIRVWSVIAVGLFILYCIAHFILYRLVLRKKDADALYNGRALLPFAICTLCFTVVLASLLCMPLSVLGIAAERTQNYYIKWLDQELLSSVWSIVSTASNLSVFLLLPFAFFYHEAVGIWGRGSLGRLYEAATVLALVAVLVGGFLYYSREVFPLVDEPRSQGDWIQVLPHRYANTLLSITGLLLFLFSAPQGLSSVVGLFARRYRPMKLWKQQEATLESLRLEEQTLSAKVAALAGPTGSAEYLGSERPDEEARNRLSEVQRQTNELTRFLSVSPIVYQLQWGGSVLLCVATASYVCLSVVRLLLRDLVWDPLLEGPRIRLLSFISYFDANDSVSDSDDAAVPAIGKQWLLVHVLDMWTMCYLMGCAVVGLSSLPLFRHLFRLEPRKASLRGVTGLLAWLLTLSSAFPVVAQVLLDAAPFGWTSSLSGVWASSRTLHNVYRVTFCALAVLRIVKQVPWFWGVVWSWLRHRIARR